MLKILPSLIVPRSLQAGPSSAQITSLPAWIKPCPLLVPVAPLPANIFLNNQVPNVPKSIQRNSPLCSSASGLIV